MKAVGGHAAALTVAATVRHCREKGPTGSCALCYGPGRSASPLSLQVAGIRVSSRWLKGGGVGGPGRVRGSRSGGKYLCWSCWIAAWHLGQAGWNS